MPAPQDQTGTHAGGDRQGSDREPDPDRAMDEDRAGDVRPSDGRPAAGAGFGLQAPVPQADQGERGTGEDASVATG